MDYSIVIASLLHTVEHYCHYCPLLPSHYFSLLFIASHYFHIKQYFWLHYYIITTLLFLNYGLDVHYFSLPALFPVVMDWLLHHYFLITTYSWALLPLLPIISISLLLMTSSTSQYFHIKQYFWLLYCIITTLLLLNYGLDVHYFSLPALFPVVMDWVLHHYFLVTTYSRPLLP